ncbi:MAG TPA: type I-E CRISPR-associated protein Cas7/Cse4/CasC [Intrasporangiaceae bacterium]|nr:type I-E CRISPR-associated protein Cas7/Cse4/CasC [Intrasporangiaceae bacterium]
MSTFIDIHVIQSVPPSNVNRDDTGSPKSAMYGGVRRSRVSSQAWKRAARKSYQRDIDASGLGYRTKQVAELIGQRMAKLDASMDDTTRAQRAGAVLKALGMKLEPKRRKKGGDEEPESPFESSAYLAFFSADQLDKFAKLAIETEKPTRRQARECADSDHGLTVSLFGRMVADDTSLNVDAAVQVAHALSTHAVDTEADYYTAVDDVLEGDKDREDSGAGMIGTIEFNSSTLYRYATINVDQLIENLGAREAAARACAAFVEGFVTSMPTGKQNTFANSTLPEAVVVVVRDDLPINLVGAFETPVTSRGGFLRPSCEAFARYSAEVTDAYDAPAVRTLVLRVSDDAAALDALGERVGLRALIGAVSDAVDDEPSDAS